ncbi:uncharacterized protein LOC121738760 [Aricia agestis]|uniref:uncharacterized protein LOC121738760 n=1 Tax=Aricia agestis TaxID=91739 RepID=UPI001C206B82|nr:uncharacterized protein LOC121738760 [Aricia agestis]
MGVGPVFFLLLAIVRTTLSYRDYPASPMPDYDLDDDTRESRSRSQYSTQKSQHADDDDDYEYGDKGDDSKPPKDFYVDDAIISKSIRDKTDTDLYNEPEMEQQSRRRKTIRHKNTKLDYEDDDREMKYNHKFVETVKSRNRHNEDYIDKEDYHLNDDDYKENDEKERIRYKSTEFNKSKPRRKPRDRPTKVIIGDNEHAQSNNEKSMRRKTRKDSIQEKSDKEAMAKAMLAETFDDIKKVNSFKDNLPLVIRQPVNMTEFSSPSYSDVLPYRRVDKVDDTTPTFNVSDTLSLAVNNVTLKTKAANKTELSLAERSRLSILKKVLKKENSNVTQATKPPILMQVTNNMQTVVLVESNNLDNDRKKARRVMDDNPETIKRAKHLMRQKLVANARRIEDLTDNWDELVCDYIDVNLLNSASSTNICYVLCCMKLIVSLVFNV